jgi:peroxiredoxin Q/BCP
MALLAPGTAAPDFTLAAAGGRTVRLADSRGHVVVLYFYPQDETPGCTAEACAFRDQYEAFTAAGAEVIGVSRDPVVSHDRFASRRQLPFVLASDPDGQVAQAYGVTPNWLRMPGRVTFVIDGDGVIRDVFSSQLRVRRHVSRALAFVQSLG